MALQDFLLQRIGFQTNKIPAHELRASLREQGLTHTSKEHIPSIFKERRPNETDSQYNYRVKNYRRLTQELPDQFLSKSSRIFNGNGFRLITASDLLNARLEKNDIFTIDNNFVNWKRYFTECIYPTSLVNPNQLFFFFPYNPDAPLENPHETLPQNMDVGLKATLIPFDAIAEINNEFLIYRSDEFKELDRGKLEPIMWAIDGKVWYRLEPFLRTVEGSNVKEIVYEPTVWYIHNFGKVPYTWLVGRTKKDDSGNEYKESFLSTAYEHLDEAIGAITDDQAVRTASAYPHILIGEIECDECAGAKVINGVDCHKCSGTGYLQKGGQLDAFVVPATNMNQNQKQLDPFLQFINPEVGILQFIHETAFGTFYKNAFRVVGLKPFTDVQESGEAKKHRLEDLQDILREVGERCALFVESMLEQIELYLKRGAEINEVILPVISRPPTYMVQEIDTLNEALNTSVGYTQQVISKQIYLVHNGDTQINDKITVLARAYAPLLDLPNEQLTIKLNSGAYGNQDVKRADYAYQAFEELSESSDFLTWDNNRARIEADRLLVEWGVLSITI